MVYLHKVLQQTKQKTDKKISCISKKIAVKMADHKTYKKLSKDKEMNIHSDVLFKIFF